MSKRAYHWVLTFQYQHPYGGMASAHGSGVMEPAPGQTRQQIYDEAVEYLRTANGIPPATQIAVQCWSLEPNDL